MKHHKTVKLRKYLLTRDTRPQENGITYNKVFPLIVRVV